ncbi:MAG: hypothetical protein ACREQQ_00040 [Candidatus Binatia bacterium]
MRALLLALLLAILCAPSFSFAADEPAPLGFAGQNLRKQPPPSETDSEFIPFEDRWRIPLPRWNRYPGRPGDYPFVEGHWWDPYNQNVIKGDYPIYGNEIFFIFTGIWDTLFEGRRLPTPGGLSVSSSEKSEEFFGRLDQFVFNQNWVFAFEIFRGNTAFKPRDWEIRFTPVFNLNYADIGERVVNVNPAEGTHRLDHHIGVQELFVEYHLGDISPWYDFVSTRTGIQGFTSDFRGFIFSDNNLGFRFFGTYGSNRHQFNAAYFRPLEKDTNSGLNRVFVRDVFDSREEDIAIANYYRQDTIWYGYTTQFSFHYNGDHADHLHFDANKFIVRPAAIGSIVSGVGDQNCFNGRVVVSCSDPTSVQPGFGTPVFHDVDAYYLGWAGEGHIGWLNVSHAFYQVLGEDDRNPIALQETDINAQMAALELSFDRDWLTFKGSFFWASGDDDPFDDTARGFDTILDNTNFAGAGFSFWDRQGILVTDARVQLKGPKSLLPSLRSSKIEGQPNFVNPGLFLYNFGITAEVTPKLRAILNVNYLQFAETEPLEALVQQKNIDRDIGVDYSLGLQYRPLLIDNIILTAGAAGLTPAQGFRDLLVGQTLYSAFFAATLIF